jgi:hypothetical protein
VLLDLPSGFRATVCSPTLRSLLSGATLAESALATPELSAETLTDDDLFAVGAWAAKALPDDPETGAFAEVCAVFGCRPSRELGIDDPVLAFMLDNVMVAATAPPKKEQDRGSDERVTFTTGGPE